MFSATCSAGDGAQLTNIDLRPAGGGKMSSTSSTYSPPKTRSEKAAPASGQAPPALGQVAPASGKATPPALDEASVAPASGKVAQSKEKTAPASGASSKGRTPATGISAAESTALDNRNNSFKQTILLFLFVRASQHRTIETTRSNKQFFYFFLFERPSIGRSKQFVQTNNSFISFCSSVPASDNRNNSSNKNLLTPNFGLEIWQQTNLI